MTKTTLEGVELTSKRRDGNSTRQIDVAIKYLFQGFTVKVMDHFEDGKNDNMNKLLFTRILDRLTFEHHLRVLIHKGLISIDSKDLTLALHAG